MINKTIYSIFKRGSKTYFYTSLFFTEEIKEDVFKLYSFVRKADNYVDVLPQRAEDFVEFKDTFRKAADGNRTGDIVVDSFVELMNRKAFNSKWVEAFLDSMELDLSKNRYSTINELTKYLFGSAEVIGLMMAKIMNLPEISYPAARYLGRAMQYANFIRDIPEDLILGRIYFPQDELQSYGLQNLDFAYVRYHQTEFVRFVRHQIERYFSWQEKAEEGFIFIMKKFLIPIRTASDMYRF